MISAVPGVPKDFLVLKEQEPAAIQPQFIDLPLHDSIQSYLKTCQMTFLSPVQKASIPAIFEGKDVFLNTETGSGKTLAYLIPLANTLWKRSLEKVHLRSKLPGAPLAVILTLSNGNAWDIYRTMRRMLKTSGINLTHEFGGQELDSRESLLLRSNVLISSPVRLFEQITENRITLKRCQFIAIDDIGIIASPHLIDSLWQIMHEGFGNLPKNRQTIIVSAGRINNVFSTFLKSRHVRIEQPEFCIPQSIRQRLLYADDDPFSSSKLELLLTNLKGLAGSRGIIFCNEVKVAKALESVLFNRGFNTLPYHGLLNHRERNKALNDFHYMKSNILVSTSMGHCINFPAVDYVINYRLPDPASHYVYQVGRCGRMGRPGLAISFVGANDNYTIQRYLYNLLCLNQAPIPDFLNDARMWKRDRRKGKKFASREL